MGAGGDVRVTLIVFERDRAGRDVEYEGTEGAVVVLPAAVIVIEIIPGELLDRCFQADVIDGMVWVVRRQLYFAEGWQRLLSAIAPWWTCRTLSKVR